MQLDNKREAYIRDQSRLDGGDINKNINEINSLDREISGFEIKRKECIEGLQRLEEESNLVKSQIDLSAEDLNKERTFKENLSKEVTDLKITLNTVDNKLKILIWK